MSWIDIKERLPLRKPYRFEQVIIAKENGVVMEALYNTKVEKFMNTNFEELNHRVTHWQPLPEPPK